MKRVYLVDSENVGDVWVPLLVSLADDEHVVVFYTQKSPHMSYENVRLLKETGREAEFIKCFEGSNALDFQLVTELGYRLSQDKECEYVIISNDTGFDAVVRYWTRLEMPVRRLSGKDCHKQVTQQTTKRQTRTSKASELASREYSESIASVTVSGGTESESRSAAETSDSTERSELQSESMTEQRGMELAEELISATEIQSCEEAKVAEETETEAAPQDTNENGTDAQVEEIRSLCCCISSDNLADFHNAMVMLFGEEAGKGMYQKIKSDPEMNAYWKDIPVHSQEEKFDIYCRLVFAESDIPQADAPDDFASFLWKSNAKRKNLNSLRAALQNHYGKERGMKYYSLFKSHIKIMNRM